MFCPKCGAKVPDYALFCSRCGGKINFPKAQTPVNPENQSDTSAQNTNNQTVQPVVNSVSTPVPVEDNSAPKKKSKAPIIILVVLIVLVIGAIVAIAFIYNNYKNKTDNNSDDTSVSMAANKEETDSKDEEFEKELNQAKEYISLGEHDAAKEILDELKSTHGDDPEVYIAYADLYVDQEQYLDALEVLEEGKKTDIRKINEKIAEINQEYGGAISTQREAQKNQ